MAFDGKLEEAIFFLKNKLQNLSSKEKIKLAMICTIIFASVLTLSVILSLTKTDDMKSGNVLVSADELIPIPEEEIFFHEEPDFLPDVILERERRSEWTKDDASLYWQDPLKDGEESWRKNIEDVIDKFLERIP